MKRKSFIGIDVWIDGGWAVDALLGEETRPHKDIDIVIQKKDVLRLCRLLKVKGYKEIKRDDSSEWNFVLGDDEGRLVDVHVIVFDDKKDGIYGPKKRGEMYTAASLRGKGVINGVEVRCISAEYLVKFHTGYELKEKDYRDVLALCEKFGIDCPSQLELNTL
jgi:lincosamide nucleotidyltransferase A/C/D/E